MIVVLVFFLFDIRSGLIVATTIPLSLLFAFICLDLRHIPANLLSIGAIDFGILVDARRVMVENIHRQLARRRAPPTRSATSIAAAAAEVDRPIVYAVAVIVAGFLPIYVLSGPSGRLFKPMADTMIFALIGVADADADGDAGAVHAGAAERRPRATQRDHSSGCSALRARALDWCLAHARETVARRPLLLADAPVVAQRSAPSSCPSSTRARSGCGRRCPTRSRSMNRRRIVPQIRTILHSLSRSHDRRRRARPPR